MAEKKGDELSEAARQLQAASPYLSAASKMASGAAVGVLGGMLLDRWLGTAPWLLVSLSVVGISVGFYGFIHDVQRLGKKR